MRQINRSQLIKVSALVLLASLASRPALAAGSVCASVQLRIQQTLTLERQAFDAHLGITNGQAAVDVANVDVDLVVTDQQGNPVLVSYDPYDPDAQNVKFFIRLDRMENISDVSGAGTVSPGTVADVHWLIIPTIGAAEGAPAGKTYRIGATLSYTLAGEPFAMDIEPDSILVKPLPELFVDYFFPADVYADDPFTPLIEPAIPFTIGQRVANSGAGAARGVAIESSQVQIVENEQDLLVGFRLEGAEVNGLAATTSLQAVLGDIAPAAAATARWTMTTTLSGRFSVFTAQYTHADELGGAVTSVIAGTGVHSLVRDVLADLPGKDQIRDFLAEDVGGYVLYESENLNTSVADLTPSASLLPLGQGGADATYALAASATVGYGFLRLADPFAGQRVLKLVQRSDGKLIGADNVWLSKTYDKTAGQWNHFVSLFDVDTTGSYTVVFTDPPDAPHAPVLQFIPDKVVVEGGELSFSVLATDADGTTPALLAAPLLAGAVFVDGGNGSGTFSWTPAEGQAGSYTMTFTAGDGAFFDAKNVLITVRPIWDTDGDGLPDAWEVQYFGNLSRDGSGDFDGDGVSDRDEYLAGTNPANRAPALDPIGAKSVAENATLAFAVTATDPDGTTPAITASGLPAGAAFDGALFSWTPTFDQAGTYAVTFRAWDGEREDVEIVQITVLNVNRAPTVPLIVAPQTQSEVATGRPTLAVENSVDPDGDAVGYQFEIYPSPEMNPAELERASGWVAEQSETTAWTIDVDLTDNARHYWRVLASDGSLPGIWAYANFFVNTANDQPGPFAAASPADGADVATVTPELSVTNSSDIDGDAVSYSFYVYSNEEPPQLIDSATGVPAGTGGSTAWTVTVPLADNAWHLWIAVATDEHGLSTQILPLTFFVNTANDAPTMPTVADPADGSEVATASVELTVTNATDLDGNALVYFFELDTADTFDTLNKVVSGPVAQGDGWTFWIVAGLFENTRYHWRCKAADDWVESNWVTASFFVNATNDAPGVPTPLNPGAGSHVDSATPRLEVSAATDPDLDTVEYEYEVYAQPPGSPVAAWRTAATDWVVAPPLTLYKWYSWRARAWDVHELDGPWTALTAFFTDNNVIDDPPTITVTEPAAAVVQAGGTFTITWFDGDPDSDASIALYRDTDGSGANSTLIVDRLSEDQDGPAGSYVWDLTDVPAGTWYVYGVISDAHATGTDYAPGSVTIDPTPVNLALNKPASASTTRSGGFYTADQAVDGSMSTSWMSSTTSGDQWVQVDLGSSLEISNVRVFWPATYYAKTFEIQTSIDGANWTQRYSTSTGNGSATNAVFTTVSARYVRVYCTKRNNRSYYGVAELEVYGVAPPNQPPVADAGPDLAGTVGQVVSFSGAASSDPDGAITGYSWDWGDGTANGSGVTATHSYATVGTRTVTLTVTDDAGATDTDTAIVTVNPALVNLALNKPASASTTRSGGSYTAGQAVDGSTSTSWMSSTTSGDQWVQVDLGASLDISNVQVFWPATYYAKTFEIQTSTDGANWTQRYSTSTGNGSATNAVFTTVSARYVRVYCTRRNNRSYYGVAEMEVYQ